MDPPSSDATPSPTPTSVNLVGQLVSGRYRIREVLGEGGMGAVYLAEHTHMRKRVALKLLHAEMSRDEEVLARFRREAEAAAHVEHPNVAAATDFGQTEDGAFFLVLEYVEGTSLRKSLQTGPVAPVRALHITRQIASALERAHGAGIVHRDLKPENVMLVKKGDDPDFVKILDFGIAKIEPHPSRDATQPLTRFGTILGTPEYMAPEQALGETVGPSADLYAVGVMLYEMLTGKHPFDAGERMAILSMHIVAPVPAMADRNAAVAVPPPIEELVRQLLEKDAKLRPAGARALATAIETVATQCGLTLPADTNQSARSFRASNPDLSRSPAPPSAPLSTPGLPTKAEGRWTPADALARTDYGVPASSLHATEPRRGQSPAEMLAAKLKIQPRVIVLGVGVGLPMFLVGVLAVVLLSHHPSDTADDALVDGDAATVQAQTTSAARPVHASAEKIHAAAAAGPSALEALAVTYPDDPAIPRAMAATLAGAGRTSDALRAVRTVAAVDLSAVDAITLAIVLGAAQRPETADEAFALLEGPLGAAGVDGLLDLSTSKAAPASTRTRATKVLARSDIRGKATPAAAVVLDMKGASTCTARREWLDRAKESGDDRVLAPLKAMKNPRGCGFFGIKDCWPCLRRDDSLDETIRAVEARGPR